MMSIKTSDGRHFLTFQSCVSPRLMGSASCILYRSILLRRPTSEILGGLWPNSDSEVSQFGFTQSNEIRDKQTKTIASSVLVFIYSLRSREFPQTKNSALRNWSGFKSHLLPDNCSMRDGFCPILDSSENNSSRLAQAESLRSKTARVVVARRGYRTTAYVASQKLYSVPEITRFKNVSSRIRKSVICESGTLDHFGSFLDLLPPRTW